MRMKITMVLVIELLIAYMPLTAASYSESQNQSTLQMFIQPSKIEGTKLGETFNVSVNIQNVYASERLVGLQFRVQYNKTLLQAIDAHEGTFLSQFHNRPEPLYTYFIKYIEDDPIYGPNVLIGILLLPDDTGRWTNFPEGNGTLATITFRSIYRPIEPSPPLTCELNLTDTMIVDDSINEINHKAESAMYIVQPLPFPEIMVSNYTATLLGEIFNVSISINNLDSDWRMAGIQFRLQYNSTLLDAIDAYEGPFLSQFPNRPEPLYTYFIKYIEDDPIYGPNVLIGILLLPDDTGRWTNFPNGSGTLATITFKAKSQPSGGQMPIWQYLKLNDTMLINDTIGEVPHTITPGIYQINPLTFTFEPAKPSAGEVVIFKVAEPKSHELLVYSWNFGDGTIENTTEPIISHVYASPDKYNVALTCTMEGVTTYASTIVNVGFYMPLEVTIDTGSTYFRGEVAEFTILVTGFGKPVNVTKMDVMLYYGGELYKNLSEAVQCVDRGLYRTHLTIPGDAEPGTYTLLVKAEYYGVEGASIRSFQISRTLSGFIESVNESLALISTEVGQIKINLDSVNATLVRVEGKTGIIDSTLGTLTVKLDDINGKIVSVNGNVATVSTALGEVKATLGETQSTATTILYVTSTLSAIAVILAVAILALLRKK